MSSAATREAASCSTLYPFQSGFTTSPASTSLWICSRTSSHLKRIQCPCIAKIHCSDPRFRTQKQAGGSTANRIAAGCKAADKARQLWHPEPLCDSCAVELNCSRFSGLTCFMTAARLGRRRMPGPTSTAGRSISLRDKAYCVLLKPSARF